MTGIVPRYYFVQYLAHCPFSDTDIATLRAYYHHIAVTNVTTHPFPQPDDPPLDGPCGYLAATLAAHDHDTATTRITLIARTVLGEACCRPRACFSTCITPAHPHVTWPAQIYITLRDAPVDRSGCLNAVATADYDPDGGLVGIEILGATGVTINGHHA